MGALDGKRSRCYLPPIAGQSGLVQEGCGDVGWGLQLEATGSLMDGAGRMENSCLGKLLVKVHSGMMGFVQLTCGRNMSSEEKETGMLNRNVGGFCKGHPQQACFYDRASDEMYLSCSSNSKGLGLPHHSCLRVEAS